MISIIAYISCWFYLVLVLLFPFYISKMHIELVRASILIQFDSIQSIVSKFQCVDPTLVSSYMKYRNICIKLTTQTCVIYLIIWCAMCIWRNIIDSCKFCESRGQPELSKSSVVYLNSWVYIKMVPHTWIDECLEMYKVNHRIRIMMKTGMATWRTVLECKGEEWGEVSIRRCIFQGDSLSPLLFVSEMIRLTSVQSKDKPPPIYGWSLIVWKEQRRFGNTDEYSSCV